MNFMNGKLSSSLNHWFGMAARRTARAAGNPLTFIGAVLIIVLWAVLGPYYGYSDTWQLIINTGTTIVTFLMVFLIQNTQNRDSDAVQLKLDELIRALHGAKNTLIDLEDMELEEVEELRTKYATVAAAARKAKAGAAACRDEINTKVKSSNGHGRKKQRVPRPKPK
jgi:low affinity Fe/Cu permease